MTQCRIFFFGQRRQKFSRFFSVLVASIKLKILPQSTTRYCNADFFWYMARTCREDIDENPTFSDDECFGSVNINPEFDETYFNHTSPRFGRVSATCEEE